MSLKDFAIKAEKISSVFLNEEDSTVDVYIGDNNDPYELKKYKFNEVVSAIENADSVRRSRNLFILEID